jgi:hypothetical protein
MDSCLAALCAGRSVGDEPFLMSVLVRTAIGQGALRSARRVLAQGEPSDVALARFQALVDDELAQPLLLQGMKGERAALDDVTRKIAAGEVRFTDHGAESANSDHTAAFVWPWDRVLYTNHRALALDFMNEAVSICRRPSFEHRDLWRRWHDSIEEMQKPSDTRRATAILFVLPAAYTAGDTQLRYSADLASMSLLLAAERHRREDGDWPDSADEIPKRLLPHPPLDPFDGQPLRTDRHDGRFFAYSVGFNGSDDRGENAPRPGVTVGPYDITTSLWDVALRRRPKPLVDSPGDVFQSTPGESNHAP